MNVFSVHVAELTEGRHELTAVIEPPMKAREAIERQIEDLHRKAMRLARNDAQVRRFMTAPGIGVITSLCFLATIDDPINSGDVVVRSIGSDLRMDYTVVGQTTHLATPHGAACGTG